jgi:hypothetical protein
MTHPYFRTILQASGLGVAFNVFFLLLLFVFFKDPLNSTAKGLDFLLYIGLPVSAAIYYKMRVNGGLMSFSEGLVLMTLLNSALLLSTCVVISLAFSIFPEALDQHIAGLLADLQAKKAQILKKLPNEEAFEQLLESARNRSLGSILFEEIGLKLMITFFTAIVAATALRKSRPV